MRRVPNNVMLGAPQRGYAQDGGGIDLESNLAMRLLLASDLLDSTANANHASAVGSAAIDSGSLLVTVDGEGATVADSASLSITGDFTLACEFKTDNDGTMIVKPVAGDWSDPYAAYGLRVGAGKLEGWSGSAGATVLGATDVNDDAWHHGAITWDGTTLRVYVDGVEDASGSSGGNPSDTDQDLQVGSNTNSGENFTGRLADVRIYARCLTGAEIAALAA